MAQNGCNPVYRPAPIPRNIPSCVLTNPATQRYDTFKMSNYNELEDGTPCDCCGNPVLFNDEDWTVCSNCQAECTNMDYTTSDVY